MRASSHEFAPAHGFVPEHAHAKRLLACDTQVLLADTTTVGVVFRSALVSAPVTHTGLFLDEVIAHKNII